VRTRVATMAWADLGTRVSRLRMKWVSCRIRHEVHYAEQRIMPSWRSEPLWDEGFVLLKSA
jgi:hypothetical protein